MYVVVRRWSNASALVDAMQQHEQEVRDIISGVPGFIAYYAVRDGDSLTSVTVCHDRAGTQESTRAAGEWVRQNVANAGSIGAPEITEGESFIQF
jgi:hypothetical protein